MRLLTAALIGCLGCLVHAMLFPMKPGGDPLYIAFETDGYTVINDTKYGSGRGIVAESKNVTLLSTGLPKRAFYVSGSPYEIGYLRGLLDSNATERMTTFFLLHAVPSLIDKALDLELSRDPATRGAWDVVCQLLQDILVTGTTKSFKQDVANGTIPVDVQHEMQGIVDGAVAGGANASAVTLDKIITINAGLDYASALVYSGNILNILLDRANHLSDSSVPMDMVRLVLARLQQEGPRMWRSPALCDAFSAWGGATTTGSGSVFARDFQLSMGQILQDLLAPTIFVPSKESDSLPIVAASGPAFVGVFTALNTAGVGLGVDTLRTCQGTPDAVGLNSVLLLRLTAHAASTSEEATAYIASARRGASYLYPMSDASGDARVLEAGTWRAQAAGVQDWARDTKCVQDDTLRDVLPSLDTMEAWVPTRRGTNGKGENMRGGNGTGYWVQGVFVRQAGFADAFPSASVLPYSDKLFQMAGLQLDMQAWLAPRGQLMNGSWQQENSAAGKALAAKFFTNPRRGTQSQTQSISRQWEEVEEVGGSPSPNRLVVSNSALFPQMRVSQMGTWASAIPGEAIQWRYDTLAWLVDAAAAGGTIDLENGKRIIEFLRPCSGEATQWSDEWEVGQLPVGVKVDAQGALCTPEYWTFDRLHAHDPLSAPVEGSLSVCDLQAKRLATKTGYFSDGWLHLTLPLYVTE